MIIKNLYDSHVHWLLRGLQSSEWSASTPLSTWRPNRGQWIVGHGWQDQISKSQLDQFFPRNPCVVWRVDRHALLANSMASSYSTSENNDGIFIDHHMNAIVEAMPQPTDQDIYNSLKIATQYFNQRGFTHIRDLSCSEKQWQQATRLEHEGALTLFVQEYFDALPYKNFDQSLSEALYCRQHQTDKLKVCGIKIFFDGAMGSEGAYMSCCYKSGHHGLRLVSPEEFYFVARKTWENNLRLAVHAIGDEAAHQVASLLAVLKSYGYGGPVDIEHAQVLRDETIEIFKKLDVTFHMQPCHWLSDKEWIFKKWTGDRKNLFRWRDLENQNLFFGSDTPIEEASVLLNQKALIDASENKILATRKNAWEFQCFDQAQSGCWSEFENNFVRTYFQNKLIFSGEVF